ncbi:hypothetical protein AB0L05_17050 [Nonomuraea pusilla]|uniref:hypothetical protein n=1 Tax=Nonomuraea pusilla TaxID=46177 RepID=UPI003317779D
MIKLAGLDRYGDQPAEPGACHRARPIRFDPLRSASRPHRRAVSMGSSTGRAAAAPGQPSSRRPSATRRSRPSGVRLFSGERLRLLWQS